jgi:hypothetical protein
MRAPTILPSRNEGFGFFGTMTLSPDRDRRSAEVWKLATTLIAAATGADSADEQIGIRDFLDSRMGRHFADDVVSALQGGAPDSEAAITATIQKWQAWRIDRQTQREEGIPAGQPNLTGWVQHFAVSAATAESD